ncbi:MAG: tetratricopeptide repeat protein [Bacteroidales bacterium]|nr:tetratricopeptide repeat protein [Bacteroidales bacterium]MBQ7490257.1 tetratricopeptide repeat protein [Bacteroidales bacterium]
MANTEKLGVKKDAQVQDAENAVEKTTNFFQKYQNIIYGVLIGIIVIIGLIIAINRFYIIPQNEKASAAMAQPIEYFLRGDSASLMIALEGNDEIDGFLSIAEDYGITKTSNTAKYYAGLAYNKLGDKENALEYLKAFKKKENIQWYAAQAVIGDIYLDMNDEDEALKYYKKAAETDDPYYGPTNLFKLGLMYEIKGDWKNALESYQRIEKDFYDQYTKMGVDKFIERAKINAAK